MIPEGLRMFKHALGVRLLGFHRHPGNARQICDHIINECWNGRYFQTSTGHFSEFWTRDFGWCVDSLIKLGYRREVLTTLEYALNRFSRENVIRTTINHKGVPFDFPCFAPDSFAFFMHSLNSAGAKGLIKLHKEFLENHARKYSAAVIDHEEGLVKERPFSSMKDGIFRKSSCYDTAMVGMLAKELSEAGIKHNLPDMKKVLVKNYWAETYFLDDLSGKKHVAGDAQIFPFWTKVIDNKKMMKQAFASLHDEGLDVPFPLRYTSERMPADVLVQRIFAPNYEGNTIWAHMGLLYTHLLKQIDEEMAQEHTNTYKHLVEKYRNFLEVYDPTGKKAYKTLFYASDEGMLWAANLLTLL